MKFYLLITFVLLLQACKQGPVELTEPIPIEFEDVLEARFFTLGFPSTAVIRHDSVWLDYWRNYWPILLGDGRGTKTPPPAINFNTHMIILVSFGTIGGCTNHVEVVEKIEQVHSKIRVTLKDFSAGGSCLAYIHPIQVVKIRASTLEVVFTGKLPYKPSKSRVLITEASQ